MITIVSGLPRSGTSLMMQMLEKGGMDVLTDGKRKADENNQRGYYEYEKVKSLRTNNEWLKNTDGKAIKIIAQLLPYVPPKVEFKVIYMVRPIEEVIQSQRKMIKNLGNQGASLSDEDLTKVFSVQTNRVQTWLAMNKVDCLFMFFPEILHNPLEKANEVSTFLGTELNTDLMATVVDKSLWHEKIV